MADHTLGEVATKTGQTLETVRKHVQRGKLVATKSGSAVTVSDEALDAYIASSGLRQAAMKVEATQQVREAGNVIAKLPVHVVEAILAGIPMGKKKVGDSVAFQRATADLPMTETGVVEPTDENPHGGTKVGFQWQEAPRWKRVTENGWKLGDAIWAWNGLGWEGQGSMEGRVLGDGISPANPYSAKRPMEPSKPAGKG